MNARHASIGTFSLMVRRNAFTARLGSHRERTAQHMGAGANGLSPGARAYHLSPEAKFPVAVDDAYAALLWVVEQAGGLGIDPDRIMLAGDRAGANLAGAGASRDASAQTCFPKISSETPRSHEGNGKAGRPATIKTGRRPARPAAPTPPSRAPGRDRPRGPRPSRVGP